MTLDYEYVETNIELDDYYNNEDPEDFNGNGKVYLGICPTATLEREADKGCQGDHFRFFSLQPLLPERDCRHQGELEG